MIKGYLPRNSGPVSHDTGRLTGYIGQGKQDVTRYKMRCTLTGLCRDSGQVDMCSCLGFPCNICAFNTAV